MPGRRALRNLELRRRELVLQSAINRLTISVELQNVQTALRPSERIVSSVRAARPWLLLLAPLAGFYVVRSLCSNGSGFSRMIGVLKCIQPLLSLWEQAASSSTAAAPETRTATKESEN